MVAGEVCEVCLYVTCWEILRPGLAWKMYYTKTMLCRCLRILENLCALQYVANFRKICVGNPVNLISAKEDFW